MSYVQRVPNYVPGGAAMYDTFEVFPTPQSLRRYLQSLGYTNVIIRPADDGRWYFHGESPAGNPLLPVVVLCPFFLSFLKMFVLIDYHANDLLC